MKYLEVDWSHSIPSEPTKLYSELDDQMWEVRKVEVYADGTAGYADTEKTTRGTKLSNEPLPSIKEIESDPQFKVREIDSKHFEDVWTKYTTAGTNDLTGRKH